MLKPVRLKRNKLDAPNSANSNPLVFWIEKQSRFSQIYVPVPIVAMTMKSQQAFLFLVVRLL